MTTNSKILIVDDVSENLNLLTELLEGQGHEVLAAPSGAIALKVLRNAEVDLILLDVIMPQLDGMATCQEILASHPSPPPIIFISASTDSEQLARAFEVGGVDYITKPFRTREVLARVTNQLQLSRLQNQLKKRNQELEEQIHQRQKAETALAVASDTLNHMCQQEAKHWGLNAFIGESGVFTELSRQIRQLQGFAQTNVLILGESGSGKELVARALHFGSNLKDKPFIAINCSAISDQLAEAELFGSVKGAFTGASADRKGFFELADGGTLFLDEVGDLPLNTQAKLLRAIEDGSFYPVGGKQLKAVKVRIISATNNNLREKKQSKQFREDLYFRLAQFTLELPHLRERLEDIPPLALHFIRTFADEMKIPEPKLSAEALRKLQAYHFPGNIRELKNILERAVIMAQGGILGDPHIQTGDETSDANTAQPLITLESPTLDIKHIKKQLANIALEQCNGNVTAAAKMIGVHRSWFYRLDGHD